MGTTVYTSFGDAGDRVAHVLQDVNRILLFTTRFASKQEIEDMSLEYATLVGNWIIQDKKPGAIQNDGSFWDALGRSMRVTNVKEGLVHYKKRNYIFKLYVSPHTYWQGQGDVTRHRVVKIAEQKQGGGNIQTPIKTKYIPVPSLNGQHEHHKLRQVPDGTLKFVKMKTPIATNIGVIAGKWVYPKQHEDGEMKDYAQPAQFFAFLSVKHDPAPDPWLPPEYVLEDLRMRAFRKTMGLVGAAKRRAK